MDVALWLELEIGSRIFPLCAFGHAWYHQNIKNDFTKPQIYYRPLLYVSDCPGRDIEKSAGHKKIPKKTK